MRTYVVSTAEARALVEEHGSMKAAARNSAYSFGAIRAALMREDVSPETQTIFDESTPVERDFEHENAALRQVNQRLFNQLRTAKLRLDDLVDATYSGAMDASLSFGPIVPIPAPKLNNNHSAEAALWHLTDWQGHKVTTSYNPQVMRKRVLEFCRRAEAITEIQRADHPVDEVVICFGGDMIEGLFNYPHQPFEIDASLFEQFVSVSRLIVEVVQYALRVYDKVTVVSEWGNHGRIGSKRDVVPRSDNIDRMIYEMSRQLLGNEPRLVWYDSPEDIQRIEVGNYKALLMHGDEIGRNGFASPMTIVAYANRLRSGAYPWDFRDIYIGHYHTHAEWPMANGLGSVYQTGSTESDNRYARDMMAASATPSQRLHFIDKIRGRVSAQYKIFVE